MMIIEDVKNNINNFFKNTREHGQKVEDHKEETQKSLKELQENTTKLVKKLSKTIQDLKTEVEKNKQITKGDNFGDRKPRNEIRSHRCE